MELAEMKNLGESSQKILNQAGIHSSEELIFLGAEAAFLMVRDLVDEGVCLHFLYGVEGAIQNRPKKELDSVRKQQLKLFYQGLS